jgi:RNA polymerase sigma-70 factor, ECF subfamily
MTDPSVSETTQLLKAWAAGDQRALETLIPRVYRELRRLAGRCLQNELADVSRLDWQHGNHFFAVSATLMRRILVDRAQADGREARRQSAGD